MCSTGAILIVANNASLIIDAVCEGVAWDRYGVLKGRDRTAAIKEAGGPREVKKSCSDDLSRIVDAVRGGVNGVDRKKRVGAPAIKVVGNAARRTEKGGSNNVMRVVNSARIKVTRDGLGRNDPPLCEKSTMVKLRGV